MVQAEQSIATVLMGMKEFPGALDHASAALAKAETLLALDSTNGRWRVAVAVAQAGVGSALKLLGRNEEAKGHFDRASAVLKPTPAQADAKP